MQHLGQNKMINQLFSKRSSSSIRLCVIGNSHVGALKLAWSALNSEYPDIEITFFASPGKSVRKLKARGSKILPVSPKAARSFRITSEVGNRINVKQYDAFLCYGTLPWRPIVESNFSRAFSIEAASGVIQRAILTHHLKLLNERTQKPIFASTAPLPTQVYREKGELLIPADEFRETIQERYASAYGVELIWQPEETLVEGGFATRDEFSTNSLRLESSLMPNNTHPEADIEHMNQSYGEAWLRAFLPRLQNL
ncbi:hypothetical protein [Aliiroseovarius sp. S253]|uniref:hypothetical protein n=1 Tax=Aliiroseovarius sp. S253 TaxID=3415133 RepID=UPI003C7DE748